MRESEFLISSSMTPVRSSRAALTALLCEAAEHRRKGDLAAAMVAETAALLALRSAQQPAQIKTTTGKEARLQEGLAE